MLVYSHWHVHLRMDLLSAPFLGWAGDGRVPCWIRFHISVQLGEQLPGGQLSTSSGVSTGSKDIPAIILGRFDCAIHDPDVPHAWVSMGWISAGVHLVGLLRNSVCVLLQGRGDTEAFALRVRWRRGG